MYQIAPALQRIHERIANENALEELVRSLGVGSKRNTHSQTLTLIYSQDACLYYGCNLILIHLTPKRYVCSWRRDRLFIQDVARDAVEPQLARNEKSGALWRDWSVKW